MFERCGEHASVHDSVNIVVINDSAGNWISNVCPDELRPSKIVGRGGEIYPDDLLDLRVVCQRGEQGVPKVAGGAGYKYALHHSPPLNPGKLGRFP